MTNMLSTLNWSSLTIYFLALILLWRYITLNKPHAEHLRAKIIMLTLMGLILHALDLYMRLIESQSGSTPSSFTNILNALFSGNIALGHFMSSVAVFATLAFVLLSMLRSTLNLGLAIIPSSILGLLAGRWLNPAHDITALNQAGVQWHLAAGLIGFALLSLAFAQSCLILLQEKQLKKPQKNEKTFIALPALQSMEYLLFQLLWLGFIVLSLNLVFGGWVNFKQYGTIFLFNHHIFLSLLTWLAYAILLTGHHFLGWRGRQASIYTIICYSLFLLGYFGPRAVRELIIN